MNAVESELRREIEREGPVSFARFMELALYHPEAGYYEGRPDLIGRAGDYYTSVSTGSLFAELLAFQFAEWLAALAPGPLQLVEAGAHDGSLAAGILGWLGKNRPDLQRRVQYWIIEPSPRRRQWQADRLAAFGDRVGWADDPALGREPIRGVVFANEFLDAFPVERFGWDAAAQGWFEWRVGLGAAFPHGRGSDMGLAWHRAAVADRAALEQRFAGAGFALAPELMRVLPDGFTLELSAGAGAWWGAAARVLSEGRLLTIDYGFGAEEFLDPRRAQGTLRAYRRHQLQPDPLASPGEQDLTAHVNFTQLQRSGEAAGAETEPVLTQAQFLTRIAERCWEGWTWKEVRQFQTLVHPEHLGRSFRVFLQRRGGG